MLPGEVIRVSALSRAASKSYAEHGPMRAGPGSVAASSVRVHIGRLPQAAAIGGPALMSALARGNTTVRR